MTFLKRSTPPRKMSPRKEAERKSSGEKVIWSTIAGPRKKPKPRNAKRKASEFSRCYGSRARVQWVKSRPCLVANAQCRQPIENAHVTDDGTKGMGRKSGFACIAPLCRFHHFELHIIGPEFESRYGVSLAFAAAQTEQAWQAHENSGAAGPL
jgi:hypothetical protein